jgi:stearoyl-CoA desaturase (delta-9 desaturase)
MAPMAFLDRVLDPPSYGFTRNGELYVPTHREILSEFFRRLNVFRDRKNWLPFLGWTLSLSTAIPLAIFFTHYCSIWLVLAGFFYSMVILGSHGTFWLHRYGTHRAYTFSNDWVRFICRNLVVKIIPEEIYIVSHYVHHQYSEKPGDPYNVHAGWLYCFLADVNHQTVRKDLTEAEYTQMCQMLKHTGVRMNSYAQYLKWGSICHPFYTVCHYALNWAAWYGIFYAVGGHALATCLFGWSGVWAIGVRTYNYDGHGRGKDKRREGIDFNRKDMSINQVWPGYVAGEWHNNHHLYQSSACNGFLPYQLDMPWQFIRFLHAIGGVSSYRNFKNDFIRDYYEPYLAAKRLKETQTTPSEASCAALPSTDFQSP